MPYEAFRKPDSFCCPTNQLPSISNKPNIPQNTRRQLAQFSDESEESNRPERTSRDEPQQVKWALRRRHGSERSTQPYSAPSGIVAQQSENFQRFYRAVVSPSHVRVTAGGRIVPNTRTIAPLPFEWDTEKQQFEPTKLAQEDPSPVPSTHWPSAGPAPVFPPFAASGMIAPYHLQGHNSMLPVMTSHLQHTVATGQQSNTQVLQSTSGDNEYSHRTVQLSPATQFDRSKPFVFQGQVVYPVTQGYQAPVSAMPIPLTMIGNGSIPLPLPAPTQGFFNPQMSVTGMHNPLVHPPGFAMISPYAQHNLNHAPAFQTLSSVNCASEFTKAHLRELDGLLRTIDLQLENNKHQIGNPLVLKQRSIIVSQVKAVENMLSDQLTRESNVVAANDGVDVAKIEEHKSSFHSVDPTSGDTTGTTFLTPQLSKSGRHTPDTASQQFNHRQGVTLTGTEVVQSVSSSGQEQFRSVSQSNSRLSAAAAMAPPFQPRSFKAVLSTQSSVNYTSPQRESFDASRQLDLIGQAPAPEVFSDRTNVEFMNSSRAQPLDSSFGQDESGVEVYGVHKTNSLHETTSALAALASYPPKIPYLVGTLPAGLKPSDATPHDLIYSRPLTDVEVQARQQYWGNGSRRSQSGLPKFDGKDFYPPSPIKHSVRVVTPVKPITTHDLLPDFSNLFTEPVLTTPPPSRADSNYPHLRASPHEQVLNEHIASSNLLSQATHGQRSIRLAPPDKKVNGGRVDFASLFLEPGAPGYKSPPPPPVGPFFLDMHPEMKHNNSAEKYNDKSETSTIEICLSPQKTRASKQQGFGTGTTFQDRVANLW